jgi:hypothetical protein
VTRRDQNTTLKGYPCIHPLEKLRELPTSIITHPSTTNHEWHKPTMSGTNQWRYRLQQKGQGFVFFVVVIPSPQCTQYNIMWLLLFPTSSFVIMLFYNAIVAYGNLFCILVWSAKLEGHFINCHVEWKVRTWTFTHFYPFGGFGWGPYYCMHPCVRINTMAWAESIIMYI